MTVLSILDRLSVLGRCGSLWMKSAKFFGCRHVIAGFLEEMERAACLNYYIKQCCAPCRGHVKEREYRESVQEAVEFLRGGSNASVKLLTEKMNEAAEALEFERAAKIRDRLSAIKKVAEKQKVVSFKVQEQDVIALAQGSNAEGRTVACAEVFRFHSGRLYDRETFLLGEIGDMEQARGEFLEQYYSMRDQVPPKISLDGEAADTPLLEEWLTKKAGRKVSILVPATRERATTYRNVPE